NNPDQYKKYTDLAPGILQKFGGQRHAVGIHIEQEAGIRTQRFHQGRKLQRHGIARGGWLLGEADAFDLLVHENEFGPEALVGAAQNQRGGAVAAIHQDAEFAQGGEVVLDGQVVEIAVDGAGLGRHAADLGPLHEGKLLQMVDIEQLAGFSGGKVGALAAEEFQRVPLGAVVAG